MVTDALQGAAGRAGGQRDVRLVRVWDPLVRIFHWSLVAAFFIAYFTEDDLLALHVWAGYVVGGLVVLRILWGFIGPKHARFSDFVFRPATVWRYARDLLSFRSERYLGHSPAGGAMILALLAGLLAVVWSGLEVYADEENAGPLAAIATAEAAASARAHGRLVLASEGEREYEDYEGYGEHEGREGSEESVWEEIHEVLANAVFVLVILHIGGVVLSSLAHHENLVRAMLTGKKRVE